MRSLRVSLLGTARVNFDPSPGELRLSHQALALFAYLVLHRTRRFSRDVLATVFWGEHDEHHARSCLNTAFWRLRRVLEPRRAQRGRYLIATPAGDIGFNSRSDYTLDVEDFESLTCRVLTKSSTSVDEGDARVLEEAINLYSGELLEGFYEEWALEERRRVHHLYVEALTRLMRFHAQQGATGATLACAQRLLRDDPLREEVHCVAMRSYLDAGQRPLALRQYHQCRALLAQELGVSPSAETQRLYARILDGHETALVMAADAEYAHTIEQASAVLRSVVERLNETRVQLGNVAVLVEQLYDPVRVRGSDHQSGLAGRYPGEGRGERAVSDW